MGRIEPQKVSDPDPNFDEKSQKGRPWIMILFLKDWAEIQRKIRSVLEKDGFP